jgi:type IV secretory pathway TrbD component
MRLTTRLDRFAKRHPILSGIACAVVIFVCLAWAHAIDQQNTASLYWSLAAGRGT